jgi:hypothetical protein
MLRPLAIAAGACLLAIFSTPTAQSQDQPAIAGPQFVHRQPSFFVRLDANHQTRSYREGDGLVLHAVSEADCYAYVFYHQADGKSFQVFPNAHQRLNRLKARQAVRIPAEEDLFRWSVAAPFGKERVTLLCTKEPIDALDLDELKSGRFNPVSAEALKGVALELGNERPSAWAIDEIEIFTHPRSQELRQAKSRRVGVFFGVANYQFHVEAEAAGTGLNLTTCHRDARRLRDLMQEVGELEEAKVYTNEQATRANFEQATTGWLPSITRPGDTVFIYFSGHGSQIDDDQAEEADGQDELLLPYDYVSPSIVAELVRRAAAGTLDARQAPRAAEAVEIIRQAGSDEAAAQALARHTGVTDDLLAHWLQRLAGRHVVVILDICHAGGFSAQEKDLAARRLAAFDFAAGERTRLKDLGQQRITLLSACGAQETATIRREDDLSVMTYYLAESLAQAAGPLSLDQAYEDCRRGMQAYFQNLAAQAQAAGKPPPTGHTPQLFAEPGMKVWLKP